MKDNIEMTKPVYYLIVGLCSIIIMANSMEALIKVKDNGLFELWLSNPNLNVDRSLGNQELYSIYLTMCLSVFFIRVITPIALAINSYFALIKLRVNKLFVSIWSVLLIGLFAFTSVWESFYSIFFIASAICYVVLVCILFYLGKEINKKRKENVLKRAERV